MATTRVMYDLIARDRGASRTFGSVGRAADGLSSKIVGIGRLAARAFRVAAVAGGALVSAGTAIGVRTAASLEQANIAFETLLGSGRKAQRFLRDLTKFAERTPFELPGLIDAARQLIGVGQSAESVIPTLRAWGNAAGALGLNQEQFNRVLIAVTQSMAKGKVQAEELMQITEAGVPIWPLLARAMGKTVPELQELSSKGELLAKDVFPALERQMQKDYGGAMSRQSRTLTGLWSTLMDTINIGLANTLEPLLPMMKDSLSDAIRVAGRAFQALPGIIERVGPAVSGFVRFVKDTAVPTIIDFGRTLVDRFIPVDTIARKLKDAQRFISDFIAGFTGDQTIPSASDMMEHVFAASEATTLGIRLREFLSDGIGDAIENLDWNRLGREMGTGLRNLIEASIDFGEDLSGKIGEVLGRVDWVDVGRKVGGRAIGFAIGFLAGLGEDLFDPQFWREHFWDVVLAALTVSVAGKFAGGLAKVVARIPILRAFAPMLERIGRLSEPVTKALMGVFRAAGKFAAGILRPLLEGFRRVFPQAGKRLGEWIGTLGTRIGVVAIDVWEKARAMVRGIGTAIINAKNAVLSRIGQLIGLMVKPFVNAGSWLVQRGRQFVQGLLRGAGNAARGVGSWVNRNVITRVTGAFSRAGSWLFDAGRRIVQGLIDGIASKARALANKVSQLASTVTSHFPFSPAKTGPLRTHPPEVAGARIAELLASGMLRTRSAVADAAARVASAAVAAPAAGRVSVAGSAPLSAAGAPSGSGSGGIVVNGPLIGELRAYSDRFSTKQVMDDLALHGVA